MGFHMARTDLRKRVKTMPRKGDEVLKQQARRYARQFLAKKYYLEYRELYKAYMINRGVKPNTTTGEKLVDERELLKENGNA